MVGAYREEPEGLAGQMQLFFHFQSLPKRLDPDFGGRAVLIRLE